MGGFRGQWEKTKKKTTQVPQGGKKQKKKTKIEGGRQKQRGFRGVGVGFGQETTPRSKKRCRELGQSGARATGSPIKAMRRAAINPGDKREPGKSTERRKKKKNEKKA